MNSYRIQAKKQHLSDEDNVEEEQLPQRRRRIRRHENQERLRFIRVW